MFITFEGGEGAGKSTLIEEIARKLAESGHPVLKTREPGGTPLGEHIRQLLLEHNPHTAVSAYAELCLFLASRAQHVKEVIAPALANGRIVLCDRFNDSTIAYQGIARGLGLEEVERFCHFVCQGVEPDLTLYLDIDPHLGLTRARRGSTDTAGAPGYDRIESEGIAFHTKIRAAFLQLEKRKQGRMVLLDAAQSPALVLHEAMRHIQPLLSHG